jgi:putative sigma-54 modulation protein
MSLYIRSKNLRLSEKTREHFRFRLMSILDRFGHRIQDVDASLSDLNGPKGGVDKQCRVVVRLRPNGKVTIQETESNIFTAFARALDRAKHAVGRTLERRHDAKSNRNGFNPRQME